VVRVCVCFFISFMVFVMFFCKFKKLLLLLLLQSVFLAPQKVVRTAVVEDLLRPNSVHNTIYQSGKSPEARAWLDAIPKTEALTMSPSEYRTAFRNRLLIPHPQLLAHTTCACGQDVDVLGVHTQKCRLDDNLTTGWWRV